MLEYWLRDKFWDLVPGCLILCLEMLETSVPSLWEDQGLITALGGVMKMFRDIARMFRIALGAMLRVFLTCRILRDVFTRIAKDVVGHASDRGAFVLTLGHVSLRLSLKRMPNSGSDFYWKA
ncbi:hypothetical protein F2Q69_00006499 [Brassica cretica]|uniref:Uncharacterized protein n=1 Tax=Brassica cretica TaxID=69181 RepID=A0A8S9P5G4_BRACR|nr:hypothetical protein F2Q69_00006499 [Brassica cretica]